MKKSGYNSECLLDIDPKPLLLVLSGPSGAGKDAVLAQLKEIRFPLEFIVTTTTRPRRCSETDGIEYRFVSEEDFRKMIETNELLEWANVYGNLYGVPRQPVKQALAEGKDAILKIDTQGAATIKKILPKAVFIFLTPLSKEDLADRLRVRNSESVSDLELRLKTVEEEMKQLPMFDYVVVNEHGQIDRVISDIKAIITTEKLRVTSREYYL
ncbi:MAG TPA: guanylate kinase [Dehalococcoidia bacterium]|nr:guanylate kinase [Dehalococcoidia bacterium]